MKMNILIRNSLIFLSMLILCSCSLLSPIKSDESIYELSATPGHVGGKHKRSITLLVMQPDSTPAYNTPQMVYSIKPYQIAYFSQNRWAATPAQMLAPLIVHTLQNTHHFRAVVSPPFIGNYDYVLNTEILQLKQDFTCLPALLRLKVRARLSSTKSNRVIAVREFSIIEPLTQNTPYAGVLAANCATENFLRELALFTIKKTV